MFKGTCPSKKPFQVFKLSVKNAYTCPIAYEALSGILRIK